MRLAARAMRLAVVVVVGSTALSCQVGHEAPTTSRLLTPSVAATPAPKATPTRPPAPATNLKIAGALSAKTSAKGGPTSCFFGQPFPGEVDFITPAMALSDGQWMMFGTVIPPTAGTYKAASLAADGLPRVRAFRTTRAAGGGMAEIWYAVSGTFLVTRSDNVGDPDNYGVVAGSVDVRLALEGGKQQITVQGAWGCVIEPVANGGS